MGRCIGRSTGETACLGMRFQSEGTMAMQVGDRVRLIGLDGPVGPVGEVVKVLGGTPAAWSGSDGWTRSPTGRGCTPRRVSK